MYKCPELLLSVTGKSSVDSQQGNEDYQSQHNSEFFQQYGQKMISKTFQGNLGASQSGSVVKSTLNAEDIHLIPGDGRAGCGWVQIPGRGKGITPILAFGNPKGQKTWQETGQMELQGI